MYAKPRYSVQSTRKRRELERRRSRRDCDSVILPESAESVFSNDAGELSVP